MEHATAAPTAPPARIIPPTLNPTSMSAPPPAGFAIEPSIAPPAITRGTLVDEPTTAQAPVVPEPTEIVIPRFTPRIREALQLLADAAACAQDVGSDIWQFSVELSALRRGDSPTTNAAGSSPKAWPATLAK